MATIGAFRVYAKYVQGEYSAPAMAIYPKGIDMSEWVQISPSEVQYIFYKFGLEKISLISEQIATDLTAMRNTHHAFFADEFGWENKYSQLHNAVQSILEIAPSFVEAQIATIQSGMAGLDPRRVARQNAMQWLLDAAQAVQQTHTPPSQKPKGGAHWHDDAYYLALSLQSASMQEIKVTYPDTAYVKFIEEALNLAKVNNSGRRAISDELKRRKSDPFWKAVRGQAISAASR